MAYLLILSPLLVGYRFLPNTFLNSIAYDAIALSCLLAILVGVRINRPAFRLPWFLLATGVALWLSGDIVWSVFENTGSAPFPSIADVMYVGAYPFFASGVYLLVRRHAPRGDRTVLLDAAIVTIGIGVLAWTFLMQPYAQDQGLTFAEKAVSLAYPIGDVLVLSVLVRIVLGTRARSAAYLLIASGLALSITSDSVYGLMLLEGSYYTGHFVDFGWLLFYACWGAAALHPSMAMLSRPAAQPHRVSTWWRLSLLTVASILAPVVAIIQLAQGNAGSLTVITAASVVLFLLVILRMGGVLARLESTLSRLRRVEREKGRLLDRTMRIGEEERARIADELHDGPIQQLSALAYRFEAGLLQLREGNHESAAAALGIVRDSFGEEIKTLGKMMSGLRPPELDTRGLETGLRDQLAAFQEASGIRATLDFRVHERLPREVETMAFRVVQEALANAARHSGGRNVRVELQGSGPSCLLTVADDGAGFDVRALTSDLSDGRFGLLGMRQRVEALDGRFEVRSSGSGTTVRAVLDGSSHGEGAAFSPHPPSADMPPERP